MALCLDQLRDPFRFRAEVAEAGQERDGEEDEPDHDPVVAQAPEGRVPHEAETEQKGAERSRYQHAGADPFDVLHERDEPLTGARRDRPQRKELVHRGTADPEHRATDVRELQEVVPGHGSRELRTVSAA